MFKSFPAFLAQIVLDQFEKQTMSSSVIDAVNNIQNSDE